MSIKMLGVPMHFGSDCYGVNYGINKLIEAEPRLKDQIDIVDVKYDIKNDEYDSRLKYLYPILDVCENVASETNKIVLDNNIPLIIGGDHSISIGSIAGVARTKKIGVIWVDAHGDMNIPETTPSGHIHGMPLAVSQGYGDIRLTNCYYKSKKVNEKNVVLFGVRDLDKEEAEFIKSLDCTVFSYDNIIENKLKESLSKAYEILMNETEGIHLSFDLDCIRPQECPGVSVPVDGGFTIKEIDYIMDFFLSSDKLVSIDLVEYNPVYDNNNKSKKIVLNLIEKIKNHYNRI